MAAAAVIAGALAPMAIPFVLGDSYATSIMLFQLALLGLPLISVQGLMTSQWIGRGYFTSLSLLSVIAAILQIAVSMRLVSEIGARGGIYANLITQAFLFLANAVFAFQCELRYRRAALVGQLA